MRAARRAPDQLHVDSGAAWRTVLAATLAEGKTPPVLPNYLGLTVGGTLSIGGIGTATLRYGSQVDQARELHVVTGTGEVVVCSEGEHPDLFYAVLAGQGQCGIIARAVLRLVAARPRVREYMLQYSDLATLKLEVEVSGRAEALYECHEAGPGVRGRAPVRASAADCRRCLKSRCSCELDRAVD